MMPSSNNQSSSQPAKEEKHQQGLFPTTQEPKININSMTSVAN